MMKEEIYIACNQWHYMEREMRIQENRLGAVKEDVTSWTHMRENEHRLRESHDLQLVFCMAPYLVKQHICECSFTSMLKN